MKRNLGIIASLGIVFALACSKTTEPDLGPQGRVVLSFATPPASAAPRDGSRITAGASDIDSVVLRVFRPGTPIVQEGWTSASVTSGVPIELAVDCLAENGKRVSVDLFEKGSFTYHGFETDVDVAGDQETAVSIDAYAFSVPVVAVTPAIADDTEPFDLRWNGAPAATAYRVQTSHTSDFAAIEWQQSFTDTVATVMLPPGSHFFRVMPTTEYASGAPSRFEFGYVTSGSNAVTITGFQSPGAIPGDVMRVLGENLDYPGTSFAIGALQMTAVSTNWGSADLVVPRAAVTERITVTSGLGTDTSDDALIVQRVAYVTSTGEWAVQYTSLLMGHWEDFGFSGVATIPIVQLDTRDMGVFDIVIVADDTGTNANNWGGGVAARATAIAASTVNVLALGQGGLSFLQRVGVASGSTYQTSQTSYYTETPNHAIYTTPHTVTSGGGGQWFDVSQNPASTFAIGLSSPAPSGVSPLACTALDCLLVLCSPNERWSLLEYLVPDAFSLKKRYVFWGFTANPNSLTSEGEDLLANTMHLLYNNRTVPPVDTVQKR